MKIQTQASSMRSCCEAPRLRCGLSRCGDRRAQVSLFVILAILIVAVIVVIFVVRGGVDDAERIPIELAPVYDHYLDCVESETLIAVQIAGTQGGRIETGEYIPGSDFAPFSSHLNFLGFSVPYWYYVSGNGVIRENVPTKEEMEMEIARFIEEGLGRCDFEEFYAGGFEIERELEDVKVDVEDMKVNVEVRGEIIVERGDDVGRKSVHRVKVDSKLGRFYDLAREVYGFEKRESFLENYAADVLYLNAPVEGVDIGCGPKIWSTQNVINDLKESLEVNFATIKLEGDSYTLKGENREYFVIDVDSDEAMNIVYSRNWPTRIEINGEGVDEEIMIAEPVGTQEGLGVMGFCYVPYHFVYDLSFPALIQFYDEEELFQFPVSVIVDKNLPREAAFAETLLGDEEDFDLCAFETEEIEVNLFDVNLRKVDGNLSYECFNQKCRLGGTDGGRFRGVAPACYNGYLSVRADGFADKKELFSTNSESTLDIIMEREHELDVELIVGGSELAGSAVVSFVRDDGVVKSLAMPQMDGVKLVEGNYEIKVYVYGNSSVSIPASSKTECFDVARGGLLGMFGGTKKECVEINLPETKIERALIGGGKMNGYFLESELERGGLTLRVDRLPNPDTLEKLGENFELFETKNVRVEFYDV